MRAGCAGAIGSTRIACAEEISGSDLGLSRAEVVHGGLVGVRGEQVLQFAGGGFEVVAGWSLR